MPNPRFLSREWFDAFPFPTVLSNLAILAVVADLFDALTTVIGLETGGRETNSFSVFLMGSFGLAGWLAIKLAFGAGLLAIAWYLRRKWDAPYYMGLVMLTFLLVMDVWFLAPVLNNVFQLFLWSLTRV